MTREEMAIEFLKSQEWKNKVTPMSDEEFVKFCYTGILGRECEPSEGEIKYWVYILQQSVPPEPVPEPIPGPVPPPTPPPQGDLSEKMRQATLVNIKNIYGDHWIQTGITEGGTKYFLIDPKGVGVKPPTLPFMQVVVEDTSWGSGQFSIKIMEVDTGNNLHGGPWTFQPGTGGIYRFTVKTFTVEEYDQGVRLLLEVTELGAASVGLNIKWR